MICEIMNKITLKISLNQKNENKNGKSKWEMHSNKKQI